MGTTTAARSSVSYDTRQTCHAARTVKVTDAATGNNVANEAI